MTSGYGNELENQNGHSRPGLTFVANLQSSDEFKTTVGSSSLHLK